MKKMFRRGSSVILLLFCLSFLLPVCSAELVSFHTKGTEWGEKEGLREFFTGLAVLDDQSFFIKLDEQGKAQYARVESFLIFSPEAIGSLAIQFNDNLKEKDIFAVKLIQEFDLKEEKRRVIRATFYSGNGEVIDERSFDDSQWRPVFRADADRDIPYFREMYRIIEESLRKNNLDTFLRY